MMFKIHLLHGQLACNLFQFWLWIATGVRSRIWIATGVRSWDIDPDGGSVHIQSKPDKKKYGGSWPIVGGLDIRSLTFFFLFWGSVKDVVEPSSFHRDFRFFDGTPDVLIEPSDFCGTEGARGPLWGWRLEWSKMSEGSIKIVGGYNKINENLDEIRGRLANSWPNPKKTKKNVSEL